MSCCLGPSCDGLGLTLPALRPLRRGLLHLGLPLRNLRWLGLELLTLDVGRGLEIMSGIRICGQTTARSADVPKSNWFFYNFNLA